LKDNSHKLRSAKLAAGYEMKRMPCAYEQMKSPPGSDENSDKSCKDFISKRSPQIVFCSLSLNVIYRIYVISYAQAKGIFVLKLIETVITLKKNVFDI
jgi:hypothetical protein